MFQTEHPLARLQCSLEKRRRSREIASQCEQNSKIVKAIERLWMFGAEHPLAYLQGAAVKRFRRGKFAALRK